MRLRKCQKYTQNAREHKVQQSENILTEHYLLSFFVNRTSASISVFY